MDNRNQILDITKGLLIILVVLGHSIQFGFGNIYCETEQFYDNILFRCIYAFHMPLFMLISGYLFHFTNKKSYKKVITSRFTGIGIPFITYCTLLYIIACILYAIPFNLLQYLFVLKGNMWFLSSILLNCIVVSSITHLFQKNIKIGYVILWALIPLTFITSDYHISALHKYMYLYFLVGFCMNQHSIRIPRLFWNKWVFILLTFVIITYSLHYEKTISIYKTGVCIYENGIIDYSKLYINVLRFIISIIGSCWFIRIIYFIKAYTKMLVPFLTYMGQETLGIYGFQSLVFMTFSTIMAIKDINIYVTITPLFLCVATLFLCEIAIRLCNLSNYTRLLFLGKNKK